jgi:hypothetical protein
MTRNLVQTLSTAALALAAMALATGGALAYPDAQIEAELKPHFGDLLHPPVFHHRERLRIERYDYRRGYGRDYPGGYGQPYGYGDGGGRLVYGPPSDGRIERYQPASDITVDCNDSADGPQALSQALPYLAPGGALHIRAGSVCHDSLFIDKPVIIVGEADSAFAEDGSRRARLEAFAGAPCISVAPGASLELRDVSLVDEEAGRNGCVQAQSADVALVRVAIRYAGGRSAVDMDGGRLLIRDSQIHARQADSAIFADDTAVTIQSSEIRSQLVGLEITPSLKAPSSLVGVRLIGPGNGEPLEPRTVGVLVRGGQHTSGLLTIDHSFIGHWRTGLWLDARSHADLLDSRIYKSALGVLVDEAETTIRESAIGASQVGVYAGSGKLIIDHNRIHGFRQAPIVFDRAVIASVREDLVYPDGGSCRSWRNWSPHCYSIRDLPYDLSVEDEIPDWGVHGPLPYARAFGAGYGRGYGAVQPLVAVEGDHRDRLAEDREAFAASGATERRAVDPR